VEVDVDHEEADEELGSYLLAENRLLREKLLVIQCNHISQNILIMKKGPKPEEIKVMEA